MAGKRQGLLGLTDNPTIDPGTSCRNESSAPGPLYGQRVAYIRNTMPTILRHGSCGLNVVRLQNMLNSKLRPSPNLKADGDFGPRTEAAVRNFQALAGLKVDGVVGPRTWAAIETSSGGGPHISPLPSINTANAPWMTIARQEIGQSELPKVKHNPRIIQYHATTTLRATTDETAWCSSFVNWCLQQAGIIGTNSAAAKDWLNWGQSTDAHPGAIAVIYNPAAANSRLSRSGNHVGFLVEETATHFILLGGNQSDRVQVSSYSKSTWRLKGYRWPR
jgi:uncharacterized protein (TIGR02594 family)